MTATDDAILANNTRCVDCGACRTAHTRYQRGRRALGRKGR